MRHLVVLLIPLLACAGETEDIGLACPNMVVPFQGEASTEGDLRRTEGSEVVEYNTEFPCQDIVCVASLGRGSYCTRECRSDANCPQAFECRVVMTYGPFEDRKFCTWKQCQEDTDCGNAWINACTVVPELGLTETIKLCEARDPNVVSE
ncbi:MAG: hypothetical protein ACAI38_05230 [Myxococcota bacterium]|nr:hypothetical protein [Myxococcota bacterium]